jgi:hypothetical protein
MRSLCLIARGGSTAEPVVLDDETRPMVLRAAEASEAAGDRAAAARLWALLEGSP